MLATAAVQLVRIVLDEDMGKAVQGTQRCAQIVGHRIGKGGQLAVGLLELAGAAADPRFELGVEPLEFLLGALALDRQRDMTGRGDGELDFVVVEGAAGGSRSRICRSAGRGA